MAGSDMVYVTLAPTGAPSQDVIERVAKMVNKDLFATRVLLTGKIPKIVGHYPDTQTAEPIAQGLRSLGLPVIVCRDSELRGGPSPGFRAHTMKLGEQDVAFWDKGGQTRTFDAGSLFLVLKGTIRTYTDKVPGTRGNEVDPRATGQTAAKPVTKSINIPATLMTGIPIMKTTKEKANLQSVQYGDFVRLYDRTSLEPIVEIVQTGFDYSSLGNKKALSSSENLGILVKEMRSRFPQAILDSRLTEHFKVDVPFATPEDEIEINSRLICLHYRDAAGRGGSE